MKPTMRTKLTTLSERLAEFNLWLSREDATRDLDTYRRISQEHAELAPIVAQYHAYQSIEADLRVAEGMLEDESMRAFAQEEIASACARQELILHTLQVLLLPKDSNDDKDIYLEIRAGTGGDESGLFAGDLFRMYSRYAERQGWRMEIVSANISELGGYKEVITKIIGHGVYAKLKFESGGHRVQRVPETESQGRIHTSACTVAVLPEADAVSDVIINPAEIRIDTYRASGAGGQHINKTDSAVRVTHLPTGLVVECQDDRSQHRNRAQALAVLAARIKATQIASQQSQLARERRNLIGSGDRSERIRTYNFPQGRVTDHRINLTLYKIEAIMDGDLDALLAALSIEHQADLLASLGE